MGKQTSLQASYRHWERGRWTCSQTVRSSSGHHRDNTPPWMAVPNDTRPITSVFNRLTSYVVPYIGGNAVSILIKNALLRQKGEIDEFWTAFTQFDTRIHTESRCSRTGRRGRRTGGPQGREVSENSEHKTQLLKHGTRSWLSFQISQFAPVDPTPTTYKTISVLALRFAWNLTQQSFAKVSGLNPYLWTSFA